MSNEIVVGRHGERWAVRIPPDEMPVSEFDTQAAAESAARLLADKHGARVVVDPGSDPQHLDEREDAAASPPPGSGEPSSPRVSGETAPGEQPASRSELARETQQGL